MKLIVCDSCHDVVGLQADTDRACKCGASHGKYTDMHIVQVDGPCRVIGLDNLIRYGTKERGETWVIPEPHSKIIRPRAREGPLAVLGSIDVRGPRY